ncbi:MAG: hypothetical protein HZA53_17880 [Planctomycetes bacterium]|nr:hypothetical protein [Planctomycetota bacterium]
MRIASIVLVGGLLAGRAWADEWKRVEVMTPHYELIGWGTEEEVRGWSVVLEGTWVRLEDVLQARPKVEVGKRLSFRMYADEAARREGALAAGLGIPTAAQPAWFSPRDGVLYAFRGESEVFARMMVVYGAVLQFHGLCKEKNLDLDTAWYVHGLAQALCVHAWDGKRVELGVSPRLCVVDYPARALAALGGKAFGVDPWNEERMRDPYVNWAAVRFALVGAGGKYGGKYRKLALGLTGSKMSGADFLRSLGREKDVTKEFREWLLGEQYPFGIEHGDWEDRPDGRVVGGSSKADELAVAVLRDPRTHLGVRLEGLKEPRLVNSVVLAWQDAKNYVIGHGAPPFFVVDFVRDGVQVDQARFALPDTTAETVFVELDRLETKAGAIRKQVAERPGSVRLALDGQEIGKVAVYEGPLGIAVQGGVAVYSGVVFR